MSFPIRFWLIVGLTAIGSLSCFGYAGIQSADFFNRTNGLEGRSALSRTNDAELGRSPISFDRSR